MDAMINSEWKGNVRELMNSVERGVVLARSDYILPKDLSFAQTQTEDNANIIAGNTSLSQIEKKAILSTLEAANGNKSETARRLGITRKTLLKKLNLYGK